MVCRSLLVEGKLKGNNPFGWGAVFLRNTHLDGVFALETVLACFVGQPMSPNEGTRRF